MKTAASPPPTSPAPGSTRVPPIPACRISAAWLHDLSVLMWVRRGTASVHFVDGSIRHIHAGTGAWVPADGRAEITTAAGTVAFPYLVPSTVTPQPPPRYLSFTVPVHWQDWLILHFLHGSTGHGIFGYSAARLGDLLADGHWRSGASDSARPPGEEPPLPRAAVARSIAQELRGNPAIDHSIERWAALTASSASTIRRGFLNDGWTFTGWRTATRLAAGCELLAAGSSVETVAMRVGFTSRHGFTRAFGQLYDMTPSDYARRMSAHSVGSFLRTEAATGTAALVSTIERLRETTIASSAPLPTPATRTSWHRNDVHVLAWLFKGQGDLNFDSAHHLRREGDAIWIPAGAAHQAGTSEGSVGLPIGYLSPSEAHFNQPLRANFGPEWNDFLLHRAVATRTLLRPDGYDARDMLELFADQFADQRSRSIPMPTSPRAADVATYFLAHMRFPTDALLDADIHRAFRTETGMTLAQWRHHARMEIASQLLQSGARPTDVARRVGYARLRSFSTAFHGRYGHPPREHLSRRS